MKSLICAAVLVLATTGGALAVGNAIGTKPGTTEADCISSGGTVVTDAHGNKICKLGTGKQGGGRWGGG